MKGMITMLTYEVTFHLAGEDIGTESELVLPYCFDKELTDEEIDTILWDEYCDYQLPYYEQYGGYYEYCSEEENPEEITWEDYLVHVYEQGYFTKELKSFDEEKSI